jgi:predicted  nucleic acid-binding Zn-ribbon protein
MSMPLELVNKLSSRDEVQVCNCCGRILHIERQTSVGA